MTTPVSASREPADGTLPALLQQAIAAHQAGQLDAARPLYSEFLASHPDHPTALQLCGLLHSECGEFDAAIELMQKSLALLPGQAEVANNLGNALSGAGRLKEAVDRYADALRLNPRYTDAYRNLGLCYLKLGIPGDARVCFERCVALRPGDAAAWLGLGNACKRQNDLTRAIDCFRKALELRPDYAEAHHNLGVCLRLAYRTDEAIAHYRTAHTLGIDRGELYHNLASAQVDAMDLESAIHSYEEALRRSPGDVLGHRHLNKLLRILGRHERYLESYKAVLPRLPDLVPLRLDYATALSQLGRSEDAERTLMEGLRRAPGSAALKSRLAAIFETQDRGADALQMHASATAMPDALPDHEVSYVRALLAASRPDEAIRWAERAIARTPLDQRAIAYMGLCWRLLGNEREPILNDYATFVRAYDVPAPEGWHVEEFNAQLASVLQPLHLGTMAPADGTFHGGTQTSGRLLDRPLPEIRSLATALRQCVQDYVDMLPDIESHPLTSRRRRDFDFSESWSVRLVRGGYHDMHVHRAGWISSAYYTQLPAVVNGTDLKQGWITFGRPDIELGAAGAARLELKPRVGRLFLFPSYMWHGTIPFESDEVRMAIAFDVAPKTGGPPA